MKKVYFGLIIAAIFSYAGDLNITNNCKELKITKYEYKQYTRYNGSKVQGLQFGLKNTSNKDLELDIKIYPKDKNNKPINEFSASPSRLKANYEYPFDDSTYIPIGEGLTTFSGSTDMVINCKTKENKPTTSHNQTKCRITISDEILDKFKKDNNITSDFEMNMHLVLLLKLIEKEGGLHNFLEKFKKWA